ncbi:hypothetical protein [Jannaschia sp. CCS1]|uniref:hypothetical protein n=1 Tax=Jannaschia sp. (strain CCS1) TaxID=290400 RepID=UPI000053AFDC|nr:hypothetical protein [Jannaschia sp. CCS1]ABD53618.1 hypothetical protein Jann_0701 [Jannaschia sp. CCS1]
MSSTTFEDRLSRIAGHARPMPPPVATILERDTPTPRARIGAVRMLIMLPLAMAMGAAAVLLGGIVQVAIIDGGLTADTAIPPQLGFIAFGIAFVLSFLIDRLVGGGALAPFAVTVGFVAMIWGEAQLAEMYPELWLEIYQAKYLTPVLDLLAENGIEF